MGSGSGFDAASKYSADSIEKCRQLTAFLKKRQALEEEYARGLRKLCKSVSLAPMRKGTSGGFMGWLAQLQRRRRASIEGPAEHSPPSSPDDLSLWSTFHELVDDTSQFSKFHVTFAESLQKQLIEPLSKSIKEMERARQEILHEGQGLHSQLEEAQTAYRKAKRDYDESNTKLIEMRAALQRIELQSTVVQSRDYAKARARCEQAESKCALTRESLRLREEESRAVSQKVLQTNLPSLLDRLRQGEAERARIIVSQIVELVELERRRASMNAGCADEMANRLSQIDLAEDEERLGRLVRWGIGEGGGGGGGHVAATEDQSAAPRYHQLQSASLYPVMTGDHQGGASSCAGLLQPPAYTLEDIGATMAGYRTLPASASVLAVPDRLGRSDGFDF